MCYRVIFSVPKVNFPKTNGRPKAYPHPVVSPQKETISASYQ